MTRASAQNLRIWTSVTRAATFTTPLIPDRILDTLAKESSILDFGCGYGRIIGQLLAGGYTRITGVEPSAHLIAQLERDIGPHSAGLELLVGSHDRLEGRTFDHAILCGVIEYFTAPSDRDDLVRSLARAIVPGGSLYLETFVLDEDNRGRYAEAKARGHPDGTMLLENGLIVRHDTPERTDTLFLTNGFCKEWAERAAFTTWKGRTVPGYEALYRRR